jgi:hydrogenase maturation protease
LLVAGIGNIFLGDDAFGVEVARRLSLRKLPEGVKVVDFGIRGLDLTYALLDGYESVILLDSTARGGAPGTLYVIEPEGGGPETDGSPGPSIEMHRMDPVKALGLARAMGGKLDRLLVVGCEPAPVADVEEMQDGMSAAVRAAVEEAVPLVEGLAEKLLSGEAVRAR